MLVRIRRRKRSGGAELRHSGFALGLAALLAPSALIAFTIAFWNIAAQFHWVANFFVSTGPFSHWQAWLIAAVVLLFAARVLNRYAMRTRGVAH